MGFIQKRSGPLKFIVLVLGGCSSLLLTACHKNTANTSREKGGPVTETGYVDLIAPTNYSPVRGVVCESLSSKDGALTGACYDLSGPSVALTKEHISQQAAVTLQTKIDQGFFPNPRQFVMETGILCDLEEKQCWFVDENDSSSPIKAPKHTKALFGFKPE